MPSARVNAKLGIKELLSSDSPRLPDKPHGPEGQVKENHFGIAVALDVGVCKVELTVEGIDVLLVDEGMEFFRKLILGAGEVYKSVFPPVEIEYEIFTYHPQRVGEEALLSFPSQRCGLL